MGASPLTSVIGRKILNTTSMKDKANGYYRFSGRFAACGQIVVEEDRARSAEGNHGVVCAPVVSNNYVNHCVNCWKSNPINATFMGMTISSQADTKQTRTCSKCDCEKPIAQFYFRASKGYYESRCKDCVSKQNRTYYEVNRNGVLKSAKAYRDKNPGRIRTYLGKYSKERQRLIKETVIRHFGGKCECCGEADIRFLTIDHVNNDGRKHRNEIGRASLYTWLVRHNFPRTYDLQCLCFNCNFGKNHNGGVCPHVSEGSETIRKE